MEVPLSEKQASERGRAATKGTVVVHLGNIMKTGLHLTSIVVLLCSAYAELDNDYKLHVFISDRRREGSR